MGDLRQTISSDEYDEFQRLKKEQKLLWAEPWTTLRAIADSYTKARLKHAPMRGPHEGYAVLLEEVDELWDEVKAWQPDQTRGEEVDELYHARMKNMRKEALHVAAMALAFLLEVAP